LQFKTDGFARFESFDNRALQVTAQWRPYHSTQTFVSYQTFDSQHGETIFPGDPGNLAFPEMLGESSRITRLGFRQTLTDSSEMLVLLSHQQTEAKSNVIDVASGASVFSGHGNSSAHNEDLQYRRNGANHATQWGVQHFNGRVIADGSSDVSLHNKQFYATWQQALDQHWQLDAQLGWGNIGFQDNVKPSGFDNSTNLARWLPRLGLVYTPNMGTHVRLATWRGMGIPAVGDASLAPTSLAGILLSRPSDNGQLVQAATLSADKQLSSAWLLAAQTQRRKNEQPIIYGFQQVLFKWQNDDSKLVLHWQPESYPWLVNLAYDHERFEAPPLEIFSTNDSVQEQRLRALQLDLRWFACTQWTANLTLNHNKVDGMLQTNLWSTLLPYQNSFNQVDANLNWQFNRRGSLDAGVRNAADVRVRNIDGSLKYTNIDTLTPRFSNGRQVYIKLKFAW
jgi:outer membrane receptor protein involved in Fe transport